MNSTHPEPTPAALSLNYITVIRCCIREQALSPANACSLKKYHLTREDLRLQLEFSGLLIGPVETAIEYDNAKKALIRHVYKLQINTIRDTLSSTSPNASKK